MGLFLCMCGLDGLIPTSSENFMSITPFENLLRKLLPLTAVLTAVIFNDWKIGSAYTGRYARSSRTTCWKRQAQVNL